jgi:iron complex outermembrane receptor protein
MSQVRDWIIWLPTFKGYWKPENIREVDVKGVETSVNVSGKNGSFSYSVKGLYAFTRSVNHTIPLNEEDISYGKQLPFIPVHSGNCFAMLGYRGWEISYLWNYYSQRYTTTSNFLDSRRDYLPAYALNQAGLNKGLKLRRFDFDVSFKVYNIFNERYRSILQRPMPGRNYAIQLKLDL